jgi:hypothetical protein
MVLKVDKDLDLLLLVDEDYNLILLEKKANGHFLSLALSFELLAPVAFEQD